MNDALVADLETEAATPPVAGIGAELQQVGADLGMGVTPPVAAARPLPPPRPATIGEALLYFQMSLASCPAVVCALAKRYDLEEPGTGVWRVLVITDRQMDLSDDRALFSAYWKLIHCGWLVNVWARPRSWFENQRGGINMQRLYQRTDAGAPEWLLKLVPEERRQGVEPTEAEVDREELGWMSERPNPRGPGES